MGSVLLSCWYYLSKWWHLRKLVKSVCPLRCTTWGVISSPHKSHPVRAVAQLAFPHLKSSSVELKLFLSGKLGILQDYSHKKNYSVHDIVLTHESHHSWEMNSVIMALPGKPHEAPGAAREFLHGRAPGTRDHPHCCAQAHGWAIQSWWWDPSQMCLQHILQPQYPLG